MVKMQANHFLHLKLHHYTRSCLDFSFSNNFWPQSSLFTLWHKLHASGQNSQSLKSSKAPFLNPSSKGPAVQTTAKVGYHIEEVWLGLVWLSADLVENEWWENWSNMALLHYSHHPHTPPPPLSGSLWTCLHFPHHVSHVSAHHGKEGGGEPKTLKYLHHYYQGSPQLLFNPA